MARPIRNWTDSSIDDRVKIATRARGLDVDWTSHGSANGAAIYVMRTIEINADGLVVSSAVCQTTTKGVVEVAKSADGGWNVVVLGEVVANEPTKTAAQIAAESVAVVERQTVPA